MTTASTPTSSLLMVGANSPVSSLAGAILGQIRTDGYAEVQGIGAGAINQATKAIAAARQLLARDEPGTELWCQPRFVDLVIDGAERTGMRIYCATATTPAES